MTDSDCPVIIDADTLIVLVDAEDVHATEAVRVLVALARALLSFDAWYKTQGLTLASGIF